MSGVEDNNLDSPKLVQIAWTGVKYAYDSKTDITLSAYHQWQNDFKVPAGCRPTGFRAACSGFLNEYSLYTIPNGINKSIRTTEFAALYFIVVGISYEGS